MRPHLGHPVQGPHGRGPPASTPQLDPQKQPIPPSCYEVGGSRLPGNSELSVGRGKWQKWSKGLQRNGSRKSITWHSLLSLQLSGADPRRPPVRQIHPSLPGPSGGLPGVSPAQ